MNQTALEDRLATAMTILPDDPPDPAILRRIEAAGRGPTATAPPRLRYVAALALGAAATVAALLAFVGADTRTGPNQTAAGIDASASVLIDPPSYWWLAVIAVVGLGVAALRRTSRVGGQEVVAAAALTLGLLISVGVTLPLLRAGADLTTTPPELPGLSPAQSSLPRWPSAGQPLVELRYTPVNGVVLVADSPESETAELGRIAASAGFTEERPGQSACRRLPPAAYSPDLSTRTTNRPAAWQNGRLYCLSEIRDGELVVTGEVVRVASWEWARNLLGYPLAALGILLWVLAAADARRTTEPKSISSQFAYGVVLLFIGVPFVVLGRLAVDAVRVAAVGPYPDCSWNDPQFRSCRLEVIAILDQRELGDAGLRLYSPVIFIADMVGAAMAAVALTIAASLNRTGQLSIGRRRLVAAALILLVLTLVPQVLYSDTIQTMTTVFE